MLYIHYGTMDAVPTATALRHHMQISNTAEVKGHMTDSTSSSFQFIRSQSAERLKAAMASTCEITSRLANCQIVMLGQV